VNPSRVYFAHPGSVAHRYREKMSVSPSLLSHQPPPDDRRQTRWPQ
jgi:hypothetical protein